MGPDDIPTVTALEAAVRPGGWSAQTFAGELARSDTWSYLVAEDTGSGQLVGYAGVKIEAGNAHVTTVAVEPARRREGIGSALVARVLAHARDLGARAATLEVALDNTAAREMYRRLGFQPVGIRPGYYEDTGEDALIMWLHDLDEPDGGRRCGEVS